MSYDLVIGLAVAIGIICALSGCYGVVCKAARFRPLQLAALCFTAVALILLSGTGLRLSGHEGADLGLAFLFAATVSQAWMAIRGRAGRCSDVAAPSA